MEVNALERANAAHEARRSYLCLALRAAEATAGSAFIVEIVIGGGSTENELRAPKLSENRYSLDRQDIGITPEIKHAIAARLDEWLTEKIVACQHEMSECGVSVRNEA
ncbi:MAG TPA: hypothetical protein VKR31_10285 [Rhizomicrobium sp.]|nr:hypothetical protein [Rhizomicrobium sp.]